MDISERIKMLIDAKDMSANSFAKTIGVSQRTLSYYINGRTPSLDFILVVLNSISDISAEWLLRGKGSMFLSDNQSVDESIVDHLNHRITWLEAQNALLREQAGLPSEKREGA